MPIIPPVPEPPDPDPNKPQDLWIKRMQYAAQIIILLFQLYLAYAANRNHDKLQQVDNKVEQGTTTIVEKQVEAKKALSETKKEVMETKKAVQEIGP